MTTPFPPPPEDPLIPDWLAGPLLVVVVCLVSLLLFAGRG